MTTRKNRALCNPGMRSTWMIAAALVVLSATTVHAKKGGGGGKPRGDTTPPAAVTDLTVVGWTADSVDITWTATGDDGSVGTASGHQFRVIIGTVLNESNWDEARNAGQIGSPQASGTVQDDTQYTLLPVTTYSMAMKVRDEASNWSELSNVVTVTTDAADWTIELAAAPVKPHHVDLALTPAGAPAIAWERDGVVHFSVRSLSGWTTEEVCTGPGWGHHPSLAYDPVDGAATVGVYCEGGSVVLARREASGWTFETIDSDGETAPRLVYGPDDEPALAYYSSTRRKNSKALRYAWWDGADWVIETVATANILPSGHIDLDLAFDPVTEQPAIVAQTDGDGDDQADSIEYFARDASGWLPPSLIETGSTVIGRDCRLAFSPVTGEPSAVYVRETAPRDAAFATRTAGTWVIETLGVRLGGFDLAFDGVGTPHVSLNDGTYNVAPWSLAYNAAALLRKVGGTWSTEWISRGLPQSDTSVALDPTSGDVLVASGDQDGVRDAVK